MKASLVVVIIELMCTITNYISSRSAERGQDLQGSKNPPGLKISRRFFILVPTPQRISPSVCVAFFYYIFLLYIFHTRVFGDLDLRFEVWLGDFGAGTGVCVFFYGVRIFFLV